MDSFDSKKIIFPEAVMLPHVRDVGRFRVDLTWPKKRGAPNHIWNTSCRLFICEADWGIVTNTVESVRRLRA